MQKSIQKLNANAVGANCIRPHFEGMTKNNQKGITLIALIITVIVMLILVGVTINVALNGGLFTKAKDAARETEKKAILEQIIALAEWDNNGKINVKETVENVIEEFGADKVATNPSTVTASTTEAIVTITGRNGEYSYKITTREISITEGSGPEPPPEDDPQALSELERYFFNEDGTGKAPMSIDKTDLGPIIIFNNDPDTIPKAEQTVQYMRNIINADGTISGIIEYKGADYKVEFKVLGEDNYQATLGSDNEKVTRLETKHSGNTDEAKIKQYFLGYSGEGKSLGNLVDIEKTFAQGSNPTNIILKDNDIINASTELIVPAIDFGNSESFEVTYNQKKYIINYALDENFEMMIAKSAISLSNMDDLSKLKLYFKNGMTEENIEITSETIKFISNKYITNAEDSLFLSSMGREGTWIEYNNITYIAIQNNGEYDIEEVYRPDENSLLRKYVQYDGKNWIVLYDDETHGLQMVSANTLEPNQIILGYDDNIVNWNDSEVQEEADRDGDGSLTQEERAIYSYNNVIKSLNDKCYSLITPKEGVILDVRCLGSNPILGSKYSESGIDETSYNKIKGTDSNYVDDYKQLTDLYISGFGSSGNASDVFLASRIIAEGDGVRVGWNFVENEPGWVGLVTHNPEGGVRPVIMLAEGALDNARGSGTPTDPLILE